MRKLYSSGQTFKTIGERYGVTGERARQIIALGIWARPPKPKPAPGRRLTRDVTKDHVRMIELRQQGYLIRGIAKKLGLSFFTVQRHLSALGYGVGKGRRSRLR